ncbi:hypothetical protein ACFQE0_25955 [Methylobacterium komagatae]|uniref:HEPN AbiU2-like domain-containing protein n=1 Tax=Methylobacterium komagatae TaxID=374425 RepID=A0ABW2BQH4_9HYPH
MRREFSDKHEFIIDAGIDALSDIVNDIQAIWKIGHKTQATVEKFEDRQYGYVLSEDGISDALLRIAFNQALAYGCLFNDADKSPSESKSAAELRLDRVREFGRKLSGVTATQLRKRGVRNALAHYDERFSKAVVEANGQPISIMKGLGISHLNAVVSEAKHFLRLNVYSFYEDTFYLFNETLKLEPLHTEIVTIVKTLNYSFDGEKLIERPKLLPLKFGAK